MRATRRGTMRPTGFSLCARVRSAVLPPHSAAVRVRVSCGSLQAGADASVSRSVAPVIVQSVPSWPGHASRSVDVPCPPAVDLDCGGRAAHKQANVSIPEWAAGVPQAAHSYPARRYLSTRVGTHDTAGVVAVDDA